MLKRFKTTTKKQKVLVHFDDFYKYGQRWPGIRAALLTKHKYFAMVNNFCDSVRTKEQLEQNGAINIRPIYERYNEELFGMKETTNRSESNARGETSEHITCDAESVVNLKKSIQETAEKVDYNRMVSSEIGAYWLHEFIPATKLKGMDGFMTETQHYQYYSSSILAALMCNVHDQPGGRVFFARAAPGGKSLIMLRTLQPEIWTLDISHHRHGQVRAHFNCVFLCTR